MDEKIFPLSQDFGNAEYLDYFWHSVQLSSRPAVQDNVQHKGGKKKILKIGSNYRLSFSEVENNLNYFEDFITEITLQLRLFHNKKQYFYTQYSFFKC